MPAREHSGTPSRMMRTLRVFRHGSGALKAALAQGEITLYRAGEIAKLPSDRQEVALTQWVNRFGLRTRGQLIAARAIRQELTPRESGAPERTPDLDRVAWAIKNAIIAEGTR